MRISILLSAVAGILLLGGVGEEILRECGISKKNALFFLFSLVLLDRFTLAPDDETEISAACLLAAVWLFGNAFSARGKNGTALLCLPLSVVTGFITAPIMGNGSELLLYVAAAVPAITSLPFGLPAALSVSALSPAAACVFSFAASPSSRIIGLSVKETCLAAQLAGIILSSLIFISYKSIFKRSAAGIPAAD